MANYKIIAHFLPWEIDYFHLFAMQMKKSKYYIDFKENNIEVSVCLNMSDYIINWKDSKLPKQFFKQKFESLAPLLKDFTFTSKIYEGDKLYGHLDFQRESKDKKIDFYISVSPDMYFSETLLMDMINASKSVSNKYFCVIPEISKLWDSTWNELTNASYRDRIDYKDWDKIDTFDIRVHTQNLINMSHGAFLESAISNKWAGWFDLYSKSFWEDLCPVEEYFTGYGPYDWYGMLVCEIAKKNNIDFEQYILRNQIIFEYSVGPLKEAGFSKYYKDNLVLNTIPNQRQEFEKNMGSYINQWKVKRNLK